MWADWGTATSEVINQLKIAMQNNLQETQELYKNFLENTEKYILETVSKIKQNGRR